jgi:hypothetical protein
MSYDDAGHFLTPPYLPKASPVFGGSLAGRARADADAWPGALAFLLRGGRDVTADLGVELPGTVRRDGRFLARIRGLDSGRGDPATAQELYPWARKVEV